MRGQARRRWEEVVYGEQITPEMVAEALGGIPERKADSTVGPEAPHRAIADIARRRLV